MVDLYLDEMTLDGIRTVSPDENVLVFKNKGKDESLSITLTGDELINTYRRIRMRLETLGLKKEGVELRWPTKSPPRSPSKPGQRNRAP